MEEAIEIKEKEISHRSLKGDDFFFWILYKTALKGREKLDPLGSTPLTESEHTLHVTSLSFLSILAARAESDNVILRTDRCSDITKF